MSKTWRRVLAGLVTFVLTLYALMFVVPGLGPYVQWIGSWVEPAPLILFPFVFIAVFVLMVAPVAVLAVASLAAHYGLCRLFGARIYL